ncbi:unnamed protein product [Strongylus vulgaris]|uniref:ShKT domain-containing protein n=1 Tax=Strongylus vulgaris TaxID=40348 RepID=A0A3P7IIP2_STRVU|nr:unnamed protein product [Strongylus vulgaris]
MDLATPPCQDFVHPRTGVSDCPQRKHLCENPIYRQLMAEQCPLTCNKCNPTPTTAGPAPCEIKDFVHPRTGISDCPQRKHLCENPIYRQLMAEQCPLTCNKCNPTPTPPGPAPSK